jgi:hypothetical protein
MKFAPKGRLEEEMSKRRATETILLLTVPHSLDIFHLEACHPENQAHESFHSKSPAHEAACRENLT